MPELTLADVERLEEAMLAANAANDRVGDLRALRVSKWHEYQQAVIDADDACGDLAEEMSKHGPALLALAREALERRDG